MWNTQFSNLNFPENCACYSTNSLYNFDKIIISTSINQLWILVRYYQNDLITTDPLPPQSISVHFNGHWVSLCGHCLGHSCVMIGLSHTSTGPFCFNDTHSPLHENCLNYRGTNSTQFVTHLSGTVINEKGLGEYSMGHFCGAERERCPVLKSWKF